ncbi:MAG: dephospho-CoA kinase [Muribaculaceae bacterium]|nr:dephospho-CoA kinase [Muribaculaceae bacterium]MDE7097414.1 dephospho-CoA kinase [Muribaculaceae bacterium]
MMIGICGGIGSGKSVVSRILRLRGESVYDCDLEAKRIMDSSEEVLSALHERYGDDVCPAGGPICRQELARRVFGSDSERLWLNTLVHGLVRRDVAQWSEARLAEGRSRCFVESAILAASGLAAMCVEIWMVMAPDEIRIERVKMRDDIPEEAIRSRIRSQEEEERALMASGIPVRVIDNSGRVPVLEQLNNF